MNRRRSVDTLTLDEVLIRFENWRQNRCGKQPIPEELWSAATELARRNGVNPTAMALHLDGGKLKRRMVAANSVSGKAIPPTFVELIAPAVDQLECTIELEGRKGKLRIHWKGATTADVAALSRALWDVAS
ncbi:MAG: hypothetical protein WCB53_07045 [Terriglobales bacterium]